MAASTVVDDELSLADLVRALGRRWRWIVGCILIAALGASAYAFGRTPEYSWTGTVRVGSLPVLAETTGGLGLTERRAMPIDAIANVVAELERNYVPAAASEAGHAVSARAGQVGDSDLVELTVTAPRADAAREVIRDALERVVANHRHALEGRATQLRLRLDELSPALGEAMIGSLRDAIELLAPPYEGRSVIAAHARAETLLQSGDPLLRPTRILSLPQGAGTPIGLASGVVLALGLVFGLGAGVVLALVVDAVRRSPSGT